MADLCDAMDQTARSTPQFKQPRRKKADCHPELLPLIEARLQSTRNYDSEQIKAITKELNNKSKDNNNRRASKQPQSLYMGPSEVPEKGIHTQARQNEEFTK